MKRHAAHDRLLALKLQGATHLARVMETHPNDAVRLKAAMALARLAIPSLPASTDDPAEESPDTPPTDRPPRPSGATPSTLPAAPASRPSPPPAQPPRGFVVNHARSDHAPPGGTRPFTTISARGHSPMALLTRAGAPP